MQPGDSCPVGFPALVVSSPGPGLPGLPHPALCFLALPSSALAGVPVAAAGAHLRPAKRLALALPAPLAS